VTEDKPKHTPSKWGDQSRQAKRRDLDDASAHKAGYPSNLREETGWHKGARVTKRAQQ
jgi:hypothetical protein